jgi:hypothetical protein
MVRAVMGDQTYELPKTAEDATTDPSSDEVAVGAVRNFILLNVGILMLVAWHVSNRSASVSRNA